MGVFDRPCFGGRPVFFKALEDLGFLFLFLFPCFLLIGGSTGKLVTPGTPGIGSVPSAVDVLLALVRSEVGLDLSSSLSV